MDTRDKEKPGVEARRWVMDGETDGEEAAYWEGYRLGLVAGGPGKEGLASALGDPDSVRAARAWGYVDGRRARKQGRSDLP